MRSIQWYAVVVDDDWRRSSAPGIYWWEPVVRVSRIVDGVWTDVSEPMLDGYALVGSRDGWRHIEEAAEVHLLRNAGGNPCRLTEDELDRIRLQEVTAIGIEQEFRNGQRVRVAENARTSYAGLAGKFVESVCTRGGKYAQVVLDLFDERCVVARLPIDYLRAM